MSLDVYTKIKTFKETPQKKIYLVQNEIDGLLYVQRILKYCNIEIYEMLKNIESPYLPSIYEIIEIDGEVNIIEEYINAPTLEQFIVNKEIKEDDIYTILEHICDAVMILHNYDIIHRDIKPENIFYDKKQVVLFDFDISRRYQVSQTKDTTVLGSVGYAAPEQFGFQQTDARTDIYAIGKLMNDLYMSVLPMNDLYEETIKSIITKATHIDPDRRYQTVDEIKNELKNIKKDSWKLPGFRSGRLSYEIGACIGYGFLIACIIFAEIENVKPWSIQDIGYKFLYFGIFSIVIAFCSNYRNINNYSLFHKSQYKLLRWLGILLSMFIFIFLFMIIGVILSLLYDAVC